ncbi:translation initiation factor IF-2-like [Oenanthe melanoleuca]|uniref:translation initiation factor IF-2-like n=1 Tax=Oenanthe melanoleuca TaxID=2939378 RepID=UPI0024C1A0C3|nr:translation initiation factor IF-2-like [Oenanthe melanoleuca]
MPQRGKKKGRAAGGADPRSLPLTPAAANSSSPLNHAPNNMETSTAAAAALPSQAAPRPAAPLSSPPPAACAVPECPWRPPTPPPPSDATTPPPVEAAMPTNPSPAPHTHTSPRRSPPPEREPGSCGVGEIAAARQEELPRGRSSFPPPRPLALPSRRRGSGGGKRSSLPGSCRCSFGSARFGPARVADRAAERERSALARAELDRLLNGRAPRAWCGRNMAARLPPPLPLSLRPAARWGRAAGAAEPPPARGRPQGPPAAAEEEGTGGGAGRGGTDPHAKWLRGAVRAPVCPAGQRLA